MNDIEVTLWIILGIIGLCVAWFIIENFRQLINRIKEMIHDGA